MIDRGADRLHGRVIDFATLCGMTHARGDDFCQIAAYLGSGDRFDIAIAELAESDADQVERDHALLAKAVRAGRLPVERGV